MSRSAIEENIYTGNKFVTGTRFIDVLIYSREYLEYQAELQQPSSVKERRSSGVGSRMTISAAEPWISLCGT
jgi:hypothetical protein